MRHVPVRSVAALLAVSVLTLVPAAAGPRSDRLEIVDPGSIGTGAMLWHGPDGPVALPHLDTLIELEVTGVLIRGVVTQRFTNPADRTIEAIYQFPLPERAALHGMEMRVGARRIVSVVQERAQARETYATAKREGKKTALVERADPGLFRTRLANLNPGETVRVVLEYLEPAEFDNGTYRLRVPLTYTPRYMPAKTREPLATPAEGPQPEAVSCDPARFAPATMPGMPRAEVRVRLRPGMALESVGSPSHELETRLDGADWEIAGGTVPADRDFELHWTPLLDGEPGAAMFVEEFRGERYGFVAITPPPARGSGTRGLPTQTLFVIDVSGSMQGPAIGQAKRALLAALERQTPADRFDVIAFNENTTAFDGGFRRGLAADVDEAKAWVRRLTAGGGTELHEALFRSIETITASPDPAAVRRIVFLTDGAIGREQSLYDRLARGLGNVRLHVVGIGNAPNAALVRRMASLGRGDHAFVSGAESAENRIDAFLRRIDRPVLTDLDMEWSGVRVDEMFPRRLPDLHDGRPLLVAFRLAESAAEPRLTLRGRLAGGAFERSIPLTVNAFESSGVAVRWGRAKVQDWLDALLDDVDEGLVREAVVDLAVEFGLVTPYTSRVAVEQIVSAEGDARPAWIPSGVPAGYAGLSTRAWPQGGTGGPMRLRLALLLLALGVLAWTFRR